jgi:hypothetical protein
MIEEALFTMQVVTDQVQAIATDAVMHRSFMARRIHDTLDWGMGDIQPDPAHASTHAQRHLLNVVLDSLAVVNQSEMRYSACTDGRVAVRLHNGEAVPVREQLVGADTMLVFHMAEVLGPRFYKDPTAPLKDRLKEVVTFLRENGLVPCTHIGCGAAAAYVLIIRNLIDFTKDERFVARQKFLLPEAVYSDELRQKITAGYQERLDSDRYKGWSDAVVMDAVHSVSPDRAIAELNNDGRGIHGHVEELIIRIKIDDVATNELQVIARTHGREVFSVNDKRMQRLAELVGRGRDEDYRLALMAAEDFTDGGHGTLAKHLPTYVISTA